MPWVSSYKTPDQSLRTFIIDNILTKTVNPLQRFTMLKSAYITPVFYAAVRISTPTEADTVIPFICAMRLTPRDSRATIHYRILSEVTAFNEMLCPIAILDQLTPTTDPKALAWCQRCRDNAAAYHRASTIPSGTWLAFHDYDLAKFGVKTSTLQLVRYNRRVRFLDDLGHLYQIPRWETLPYEILV